MKIFQNLVNPKNFALLKISLITLFIILFSFIVISAKISADNKDKIKNISYEISNTSFLNKEYSETILDPWLNGFPYRKSIIVNNTANSNTLTDYQVNVTLDTASLISQGKMRSDCGDIRFTDSDGNTLLNYWIESGCNSANTKIWVKVPSIPASSTKTIYLYYGNPSANSASNIKTTFIVGDDFNDNSLDTSIWTWIRENPGKWDEGVTQPGWLMMKVVQNEDMDNTQQDAALLRTVNPISGDFEAIVRVQINPTTNWHQASLFVYQNDSTWLKLNRIYAGGQRSEFCKYYQGSYSYPRVSNTLTDLYLKIVKVGTTYTGYYLNQSSWVQVAQHTGISMINYIALSSFSGTSASEINSFYDNFIVKKYSSPEPTTNIEAEDTLITQAGSPTSWQWKIPSQGEKIRNGSTTNWQWIVFNNDGSGIRVPRGTSTNWVYGPS